VFSTIQRINITFFLPDYNLKSFHQNCFYQ